MSLEGLQLGQYQLLRLIGSGGMGEVYLGEDARINQQVAIKVSRTEAVVYPRTNPSQETARLFQREAKAIARLDHPHILPLFSYGEEHINGVTLIYIVMPYRPEGSLVKWLQQRSTNSLLSVQDIAAFVSQGASALQYAHESQIIHQDVKPSNFLIRLNKEHPERPDLLLADFGIARVSSATGSVSHAIRGTSTYMAPEQWNAEPVYASDQYALAIFAYELLASRSPFMGRQEQVMYQHLTVQPQPPSTFNPQLSQGIDAVILKALAKRPEERFASIAMFANAFQQATQGFNDSTVVKPPAIPTGPTLYENDLHATLAISKAEAQNSTSRTLTLPSGRTISVFVPAGAYDGQVLRLSGLGEPLSAGGPGRTLVLTLSVQDTGTPASLATGNSLMETIPSSNPSLEKEMVRSSLPVSADKTVQVERNEILSSSPPPPSPLHMVDELQSQALTRERGVSTGTAIFLVGLALVLLLGGLGFFFLYSMNHPTSNTGTLAAGTSPLNGDATKATATSLAQTEDANATSTAVALSHAATPIPIPPTPTTSSTPPTSSGYVQLQSSYSGTATGYAQGNITFTLQSEDAQGNVSMLTTFQQLQGSQQTATYSCQGAVTTDRHLSLQCSNVTDASYQLIIEGYVYADGHMEGTETATNTNDASYHHVYSWTAY